MTRPFVSADDVALGKAIRARRLKIAMPMREVAAAVGVSQQQIAKYEGGINRVPATRMPKIACALGCSVADLMEIER